MGSRPVAHSSSLDLLYVGLARYSIHSSNVERLFQSLTSRGTRAKITCPLMVKICGLFSVGFMISSKFKNMKMYLQFSEVHCCSYNDPSLVHKGCFGSISSIIESNVYLQILQVYWVRLSVQFYDHNGHFVPTSPFIFSGMESLFKRATSFVSCVILSLFLARLCCSTCLSDPHRGKAMRRSRLALSKDKTYLLFPCNHGFWIARIPSRPTCDLSFQGLGVSALQA